MSPERDNAMNPDVSIYDIADLGIYKVSSKRRLPTENELLATYWRNVGGVIFEEVTLFGHAPPGWQRGSGRAPRTLSRRIDGLRLCAEGHALTIPLSDRQSFVDPHVLEGLVTRRRAEVFGAVLSRIECHGQELTIYPGIVPELVTGRIFRHLRRALRQILTLSHVDVIEVKRRISQENWKVLSQIATGAALVQERYTPASTTRIIVCESSSIRGDGVALQILGFGQPGDPGYIRVWTPPGLCSET